MSFGKCSAIARACAIMCIHYPVISNSERRNILLIEEAECLM
jgi:hypothetical protein